MQFGVDDAVGHERFPEAEDIDQEILPALVEVAHQQVRAARVAHFAEVRFETVNRAVDGDTVIAEQVHGLSLPGKPLAPIKNLAVYEIRDGRIAAWRDYTNPQEAGRLLGR